MQIRAYEPADRETVLALLGEVFQPFFEESFPSMVGHDGVLVDHQHGHWRDDYARELPGLHDPDAGRHVALAADGPGEVLGLVAWRADERPDHAHVELLAVAPAVRRQHVGEALMDHAMERMRADGRCFVELGTGGDVFHEPARRLYEHLGFHAIPVTVYLRRL